MLKLILADNQAIFRAGIAKVLAVEDEMRIVAQAQTPEQMFMALVDCVRKVARGENWVQDVAVPSELTENDMVGLRVRDRLTAKELRIVALIVQGYKNKEIASQLGTTEQVIKNYLRNVYDKIGVSDRLELALFTIHHRILNEAAAATAAGVVPQPPQSAGISN